MREKGWFVFSQERPTFSSLFSSRLPIIIVLLRLFAYHRYIFPVVDMYILLLSIYLLSILAEEKICK